MRTGSELKGSTIASWRTLRLLLEQRTAMTWFSRRSIRDRHRCVKLAKPRPSPKRRLPSFWGWTSRRYLASNVGVTYCSLPFADSLALRVASFAWWFPFQIWLQLNFVLTSPKPSLLDQATSIPARNDGYIVERRCTP